MKNDQHSTGVLISAEAYAKILAALRIGLNTQTYFALYDSLSAIALALGVHPAAAEGRLSPSPRNVQGRGGSAPDRVRSTS